jgi:hypothetical protein
MAQSTKLPCPHCGSDAAGFTLMHSYLHPPGAPHPPGLRCFMQCGVCGEAIIAAYPALDQVKAWASGQQIVLSVGLKPFSVWPEARRDVTPDSVPPNIASLYKQAMASLRVKHYDAAGPVFRRIMEVSLKTLHPEGEGSLYDRIENTSRRQGSYAHDERMGSCGPSYWT